MLAGHPAFGYLVSGKACAMPYAPEDGFIANLFQPDSSFQSVTRSAHCMPLPQPYPFASAMPIAWLAPADPPAAPTATLAAAALAAATSCPTFAFRLL